MRTLCFAGALLIAVSVLAQDGKPAIFVSPNRIDGPFGGQYRVEDLQVFSSGKVLYVEEGTSTLGQQPRHVSYETQIEATEMQELVSLLNGPGVRSLPNKITSKTKPIDFFRQASLAINQTDRAQRIRVENFYPFLNLHGHAYPQALIDLECAVQNIQAKAAKRPQPADEDNWCKKLAITHGL
jgi:hypothetical protein